jgi:hypothetical protein
MRTGGFAELLAWRTYWVIKGTVNILYAAKRAAKKILNPA